MENQAFPLVRIYCGYLNYFSNIFSKIYSCIHSLSIIAASCFIPNTISGDGEELDAYVIGPNIPLDEFTGYCCAIIHRTNDDDDKLIVVPNGTNIDDKTIEKVTEF